MRRGAERAAAAAAAASRQQPQAHRGLLSRHRRRRPAGRHPRRRQARRNFRATPSHEMLARRAGLDADQTSAVPRTRRDQRCRRLIRRPRAGAWRRAPAARRGSGRARRRGRGLRRHRQRQLRRRGQPEPGARARLLHRHRLRDLHDRLRVLGIGRRRGPVRRAGLRRQDVLSRCRHLLRHLAHAGPSLQTRTLDLDAQRAVGGAGRACRRRVAGRRRCRRQSAARTRHRRRSCRVSAEVRSADPVRRAARHTVRLVSRRRGRARRGQGHPQRRPGRRQTRDAWSPPVDDLRPQV